MRRRSIFQALAGLIGAKSLPAAPVKVPASLQVAKAAAIAAFKPYKFNYRQEFPRERKDDENPLFNDLGP